MIVTSASQCRNALAAAMPAKPPPMITTCGLLDLSGGCEAPNDSLIFLPSLLSSPEGAEIISPLWHSFRPSETPSLFSYEARGARAAFRRVLSQASRWNATDFGMNAVDELLCTSGVNAGFQENFHPSCHGTGELLEKVLDAAFTAAQVMRSMLPIRPQRRPGPQHKAVSTSAALTTPSANKIVDFPGKGGLQTIGDIPGISLRTRTVRLPMLL